MKESLKIMGLNKYMYPLSIMLQRGIWTFFTSILLSFMTYIFNTDNLSFGQFLGLIFATWFLALGNMSVCAVLQNFFNDNKLAAIVGAFMVFVPVSIALISIVLPISQGQANNWVQYLYFLPTFSYEVVVASIFLGDEAELFFEQSPAAAWIFLIIAPVFYYYLQIYVEAITPDKYGITKSCCYCFRRQNNEVADDDDAADFDSALLARTADKTVSRRSTIQSGELGNTQERN